MIDKEFLKQKLIEGLSTRKIAALPEVSIDYRTILYYIHKYNLQSFMKYNKPVYINEKFFETIDTKEKAYILGYSLADGYINNSCIEYGCAIKDRELLEFIANQFNVNVRYDYSYNKAKRIFPRARITIHNKTLVEDLNRFMGKKIDRIFSRIRKDLEPYMVLGFFDGDGCLTFGHRKDRDKLWQKVCFTSSYKLLFALQKLLYKQGIVTSLYPKTDNNCFVLEITNLKQVISILEYMYQDNSFIVLHRKFNKYNALRLELGENEGTTYESTISCQAISHEIEGVETTGGKMDFLNNQLECPSL